MQRVGDLVGVDADQPGRDAVDAAVPGLEVDPLELREEPLQLGVAAAPERERAADEVLPGAALRLAETERGVPVQRRAAQRGVDALVGQPVARLVHRRPERAQVRRLVPRRHPDVRARERGRERVDGRVEPVRAFLEAEVAQDPGQELLLRRRSGSRPRGTSRPPARRHRARSPPAPARARRRPLSPRRSSSRARTRRGTRRRASRRLHVARPSRARRRARAEAPAGRPRSRSPRAPRARRRAPSHPRAPRRPRARRARAAPSPSRGA